MMRRVVSLSAVVLLLIPLLGMGDARRGDNALIPDYKRAAGLFSLLTVPRCTATAFEDVTGYLFVLTASHCTRTNNPYAQEAEYIPELDHPVIGWPAVRIKIRKARDWDNQRLDIELWEPASEEDAELLREYAAPWTREVAFVRDGDRLICYPVHGLYVERQWAFEGHPNGPGRGPRIDGGAPMVFYILAKYQVEGIVGESFSMPEGLAPRWGSLRLFSLLSQGGQSGTMCYKGQKPAGMIVGGFVESLGMGLTVSIYPAFLQSELGMLMVNAWVRYVELYGDEVRR